MIFLIDENLSPKLVALHSSSHQAIHINQLKPKKKSVIKDDFIRKLSLDHRFVLVTKDDDFVKSWVSRKVPERIIFIHDDFRDHDELLQAYKKAIPSLETKSSYDDFIEFSSKGIKMPFRRPLPYEEGNV